MEVVIESPEFDCAGLETPEDDLAALRRLVADVRANSMKRCRDHVLVVEVGSWAGRTALNFLRCGSVKVFCVDHWQGTPTDTTIKMAAELGEYEIFRRFCQNTRAHLMREIIPLIGSSLSWASVWPADMAPDLIFLDADHTYEGLKADIEAWAKHVAYRGILCGHDYGAQFPGVAKAADEFGIDGVMGRTVWWRQM